MRKDKLSKNFLKTSSFLVVSKKKSKHFLQSTYVRIVFSIFFFRSKLYTTPNSFNLYLLLLLNSMYPTRQASAMVFIYCENILRTLKYILAILCTDKYRIFGVLWKHSFIPDSLVTIFIIYNDESRYKLINLRTIDTFHTFWHFKFLFKVKLLIISVFR